MNEQELIERFARAIWNALPYDHGACQPYCPNLEDAVRAVKEAVKRSHVRIEAGEDITLLAGIAKGLNL